MISTVVWVLRAVALLAFAGPVMIGIRGRTGGEAAGESRGSRLPVLANFAAFALFFALLAVGSAGSEGVMHVIFALGGALLAAAGSVVVSRARTELGAAWSFVPRAAEQSGIVTTGPHRLVRHPIYLGLSMLALGQAVAFGGSLAAVTVAIAIVPSILWRVRVV
jgi:protein-S-isoprenylcysteine O-methyltransferase Ste14